MTIRGNAQAPGPLGLMHGGDGVHVPGPAGTFHDGGRFPDPAGSSWDDGGWAPQPMGTLWEKQSNPPASGTVTKAAKTTKRTTMPAPTEEAAGADPDRDVHVSSCPCSARTTPQLSPRSNRRPGSPIVRWPRCWPRSPSPRTVGKSSTASSPPRHRAMSSPTCRPQAVWPIRPAPRSSPRDTSPSSCKAAR